METESIGEREGRREGMGEREEGEEKKTET